MDKITDIFDKLNNTIGNHIDGKATDQDLIKMAYEIDKYLLQHPHPHDLVKNHGVSHHVSDKSQMSKSNIELLECKQKVIKERYIK